MTTAAAAAESRFVQRLHRVLLAASVIGLLALAALFYVFPDGHVFFDRGVKYYDISDLVASSPGRPAVFASAEAVAAEPLARASWVPESSSAPESDDGRAAGTDSLADEPVELSTIEVDLDRIQIEIVGGRWAHDQNDRVHHDPTRAPREHVTHRSPIIPEPWQHRTRPTLSR